MLYVNVRLPSHFNVVGKGIRVVDNGIRVHISWHELTLVQIRTYWSWNINVTAQKIILGLKSHSLRVLQNGQVIISLHKDGGYIVRASLSVSFAGVLTCGRKDATLKAVQLEALVGVYQVRIQHR